MKTPLKPCKGTKIYSAQEIAEMHDGETIYEALQLARDEFQFKQALSSGQAIALRDYTDRLRIERMQEINQELQKYRDTEPGLTRNVKRMFRFQVVDCPGHFAREAKLRKAVITVWTPESQVQQLKEGMRIRVYFLDVSKFQTDATPLQLSTTVLKCTALPPVS